MSLEPQRPARGLGYLQDYPDARDRRVTSDYVGLRANRLVAPNMRALRTKRILQGGAGACWGFGAARAIHMSLQLQTPVTRPLIPIPSPKFLYYNGRAQEYAGQPRENFPAQLADVGTRPRSGFKSIQALGFAPWDAAPYSDTDVVSRPARDAYLRAYDQKGFSYARIEGSPAERVDLAADAMMKGATIVVCMKVDEAFMWNRGEVVRSIDSSKVKGGHAVTLLDLTKGTADIDNWWEDWGVPDPVWENDGVGRLSYDVLGGESVLDLYAITAAPIYSATDEGMNG